MKVIKFIKFGKRIVLILDGTISDTFRNHTAVTIGEIHFSDAIILMGSKGDSRNSLSVGNINDISAVSIFEGKPIIFWIEKNI